MSAMCWGDVARIQALKRTLSTGTNAATAGCGMQTKPSDTCSRGRTSCSSSHDEMWDDDDVSTIGSTYSSRSDDGSTPGTSPSSGYKKEVLEPLQLALKAPWTDKKHELKNRAKKPLPVPSLAAYRIEQQKRYVQLLQSAATLGPRRVLPIVAPLELVPPSENELWNTNCLMKCVNAIAPMPTIDQLAAKHLVIHELQRTVDLWLRHTLDVIHGASADSATKSTTTATLLIGGSWHLKVGVAESDLDVVALLPHEVTADLFFSSLCDHLGREASVSKLVARRKAAVPVLSFELSTVRVDLLLARYAQQQAVPKHLLCLPGDDVQVMRGMDTASVRSLSVARVASLILELVPNASTFKSCLRVIRLWARRRGLYSNKAGFLGGISWALLVCFVCQMFPRASVAALVHRFFSVLVSWQWPTPILVAQPSTGVDANSVEWDPLHNLHDRAHLMPIITPGFPAVNTAVNVNLSTLRVLRDEFARGQRILDDLSRCRFSHPAPWNQLFTPTEVLVRYDHHVAIELRASNEESLAEWSSFVASRTRKLVETLQHTPSVGSLHPLPEIIRPQDPEPSANGEVVGYYFIGYTVDSPPMPGVRRGNCRLTRERQRMPSTSGNEEWARNCIASATRYFLATELNAATEKKCGMEVAISYSSWNDLPNAIFPGGRPAAIGDRARYILSQAHQMNVAQGFAR
uniref:polynucleotide adenylyltransferase n=2 Tax=Hyaloperonospora arabidopsidis (strain Emoy2) TaxID=559515 RepID=M4BGQ3_HYAAE|nr:RxLR effector candidate protein [Hyaloperonospora arabidopsidis Emoy2]